MVADDALPSCYLICNVRSITESCWDPVPLLVCTSLSLHRLKPCPFSQSTTSWVLAGVDSTSTVLFQLLWCRFQSPVMIVGVPGWRFMLASLSVVYLCPCVSPGLAWLYMFIIHMGGWYDPSCLTSIIMKLRSAQMSVLNVTSIPAWSL